MKQNADARFIGAEREQNASVTDVVVSESARVDGATRRWVALWALCARASLCGCALAAAARARALALSGLVALRSRRLVPFRRGDNRCAAVFSLPHAMLVNIDVVIKTWR